MIQQYQPAEDIVALVNDGERVFIHGGAATPIRLIGALLGRAGVIRDVELVAISTYGELGWETPQVQESFYLNSLFVSGNVRGWVNGANGDYIPVFLSEIPGLFKKGLLPLDVAMIQVSPPDDRGYCTLGPSVDVALSAALSAKRIIAQVNPKMPVVYGDGLIHCSRFAAMCWEEAELPQMDYSQRSSPVTEQIGRQVASLIEDGSTLQMGIGSIPDATLRQLSNRKGLGIHTEMFSDGVIPLIEQGIITNEHKKVICGKTVGSFVLGTRKIYDFIDGNPAIACMAAEFVNDTDVIRKNPKVVAINSAIEIDLTGQVCADSIGTSQYSGIGGQMDFMRGAALSEGGKPIIALPSTTKSGSSRIAPLLKEGAGVVTTRGHIHYVVTEYGAVNLYGKNMEQRARLLTSIAHPDHREALERASYERFGKPYCTSFTAPVSSNPFPVSGEA